LMVTALVRRPDRIELAKVSDSSRR
jgi:hypothetical protein